MNVVITGGRDYKLQPEDWLWLGQQCGELARTLATAQVIIHHGGAKGVDTEVSEKLRSYGYKVVEYVPAWVKHGKAAGPIRNSEMAALADVVWAFPGGRGTEDMVKKARAKGVLLESPTRKKP